MYNNIKWPKHVIVKRALHQCCIVSVYVVQPLKNKKKILSIKNPSYPKIFSFFLSILFFFFFFFFPVKIISNAKNKTIQWKYKINPIQIKNQKQKQLLCTRKTVYQDNNKSWSNRYKKSLRRIWVDNPTKE